MSTSRPMRKAHTREGLVDIPNLLAEQGRKPVQLTGNDKGGRNQHVRHYMSDMSMNRKMLVKETEKLDEKSGTTPKDTVYGIMQKESS